MLIWRRTHKKEVKTPPVLELVLSVRQSIVEDHKVNLVKDS